MTAHPSTKQQVVALLKNVTRQLQAMDESTLERVLAGGFRIDAGLPDKRKRAVKEAACSEQQIDELKAALSKIDNHEEARRVISHSLCSRAQVVCFARALDIRAPSRATSDELRDRLVEATVGFRVRSAAIRGGAVKVAPVQSSGTPPL